MRKEWRNRMIVAAWQQSLSRILSMALQIACFSKEFFFSLYSKEFLNMAFSDSSKNYVRWLHRVQCVWLFRYYDANAIYGWLSDSWFLAWLMMFIGLKSQQLVKSLLIKLHVWRKIIQIGYNNKLTRACAGVLNFAKHMRTLPTYRKTALKNIRDNGHNMTIHKVTYLRTVCIT